MPAFRMMVGLPGSGKSTWINNNIKLKPTIILSTDNYIQMVADREGKTYNEMFKTHYPQALKILNEDFEKAIQNNHDIVLDQTNLSIKSRAKKLARVPSGYYKVAIVVFPPNNFIHEYRLNNRPGKVIPKIDMDRMFLDFQIPTVDEGFDCIYFVVGND